MNVPILTRPSVAIEGADDRFPVRRIFCVGQNYAEHTREMGGDPERQAPFFFSKPADAVVADGSVIAFPPRTANLHHEVELVIAIGEGGVDIAIEDANAHIYGWTVGIDLTRRDLQAEAKKAGRPWDMAKGFDASAPIGAIREGAVPEAGAVRLSVDGELRQGGDLGDMIWSVPEIVATLSTYVALAPGDLIFTGTPAGVGAVVAGQRIEATVLDAKVSVTFAG